MGLEALSELPGLTRLALAGPICHGVPTKLPRFCNLELDLKDVGPLQSALVISAGELIMCFAPGNLGSAPLPHESSHASAEEAIVSIVSDVAGFGLPKSRTPINTWTPVCQPQLSLDWLVRHTQSKFKRIRFVGV